MGIKDRARKPTQINNLDSHFQIQEALNSEWFQGRGVELAQNLIGALLVNRTSDGLAGGIIVETEAYLGENDPSCHLSYGRTERTEPFFDGSGTVYVFKIYQHSNLNIITQHDSHPECILIRALEPTHGIDLMRQRRDKSEISELTTGPGKLTEALGITKEDHNHTPIEPSTIEIYSTGLNDYEIKTSSRVGISSAKDWPLRFTMADNDFISKKLVHEINNEFDLESYYANLEPILSTTLPESISNSEK